MGENLRSVGMYPSSGMERKVVVGSAAADDIPKAAAFSVQTTKELKQAEMKGQTVTVGEEQLIKAIEKANKALEGIATSFEFSIHEKTKQIMVKVIEKESGKLIREIPPEKILDMVASMCEKAGLLIDEKR